jgi:CubicO group peptidase (beta-lactamase class C family)
MRKLIAIVFLAASLSSSSFAQALGQRIAQPIGQPIVAAAPATVSTPSASSIDVHAVDTKAVDAKAVDTKEIARLAELAVQQWHLPGLAIAVVDRDHVLLLKGFGVKAAGAADPITPDTLFQIGSTTKAFTTTLLAMLVDEQKLQWDDPVRKHLEYFHLSDPCADSMVTVRDIVSHHTGLAEYDELWDDAPWTREEVIRRVATLPLAHPFRTRYHYNNIMLMTAGEVAASAAGKSWETLVRERIFGPLAMSSTRLSDAEWNATTDRATGHKFRDDGSLIAQQLVGNELLGPAGTIKSTARDLSHWLQFQLGDGVYAGKRLVSAQSLTETKTPQTIIRLEGGARASNPESNLMAYGMAWNIQDYRGELLVSHGGALNGFRSRMELLPNRGIGVVLLTNAGRGQALMALRNSIADLLISGRVTRDWNAYYQDLDARAKARSDAAAREAAAHPPAVTHPSHELAAYTGEYRGSAHGTMRVELENGALVLSWNRMRAPLLQQQYDVFRWTVGEPDNLSESVQFGLDADGEVKTLTIFGEMLQRQ